MSRCRRYTPQYHVLGVASGRVEETERPREMQGPLGVPGREGRGPEEVGEVDIQVQIWMVRRESGGGSWHGNGREEYSRLRDFSLQKTGKEGFEHLVQSIVERREWAVGSPGPWEPAPGGPDKPGSARIIHSANTDYWVRWGARDIAGNKAKKHACPCGAFIQVGETNNKHVAGGFENGPAACAVQMVKSQRLPVPWSQIKDDLIKITL